MYDILEISNIIFQMLLFYNFTRYKEVCMKFKTSKLYCKYIINILQKNIHCFKKDKNLSTMLDDEIYNSYLKLEKILKDENSN